MGPSQHFLSFPLTGWRIDRDGETVRLMNPQGTVLREETFKNDALARKAVWSRRTEVYAAAEEGAGN